MRCSRQYRLFNGDRKKIVDLESSVVHGVSTIAASIVRSSREPVRLGAIRLACDNATADEFWMVMMRLSSMGVIHIAKDWDTSDTLAKDMPSGIRYSEPSERNRDMR